MHASSHTPLPFIHLWNRGMTPIDSVFVGNLPGCRLDFQESAMSMTLQAAVPKRRAQCAMGLLCKATARLLHFPRACDSLIKYSYIPCKYMENTVNPLSAVCPPAQMAFHVTDKNPQMSHSLPTPPSCPFRPSSSFPSSKVGKYRCLFASAYLMFPLCPHSRSAVDKKRIKARANTQIRRSG